MIQDRTPETVIAPIRPADLGVAAELAARGMRDNPMHVAAIGVDGSTWPRPPG